ncbi:MAG: UvrB/UvrC motif-containing protein [Clostridia bacterium]|nr:UvrB/UvrC motif-containing protein [Clostridia bacterium]
MLCERCKKNTATVFYEENINGQKHSCSLCSECAAEINSGDNTVGIFPFSGFGGLHDQIFAGLFGFNDAPIKKSKTCSFCSATFSDFQKNGKTGCPKCYETFSDELRSTIRSIHGNVKHVGRSPAKFRKNREKEDKLKVLRKQLKEAVSDENFELAASLRDQIKAIENEKKEGQV